MVEVNVGDRVRIIRNDSGSRNPIGGVGIVSEVKNQDQIRVVVKHFSDSNEGNWQCAFELQVIEE